MNKTEFVNYIAENNDLTKKDAKETLDMVLDSITKALEDGQEISLQGFGKFSVVEKQARKGHNVKTGESIDIPAHKAPKFSFAKNVKEFIR